ncbi:MAG: LTA synthase family protein [Flavihumibacter sp.]
MFRMPKTLRWILLISLLLLGLMTIGRLAVYCRFRVPGTRSDPVLPTLWLGFRFDLRLVAGLGLLIGLLTAFRPLDPFRNKKANRGWMLFFFFFFLAFVLFYIIDFLHFLYLNQRLNASALSFLQDAGISFGMVWQTYPVVRLTALLLVLTLLLCWCVRRFYKIAGRSAAAKTRFASALWYTGAFLLAAVGIFGRVGQYPLRWSDAFNLGSDFRANLALNPIQSFASSFSFRSSGFNAARVKEAYPAMAAYLGVDKPDLTTLDFSRQVKPDSVYNWTGNGKPNVVLVICESFSAYKSSMWGNPLNTTPFFDSLCRQGIFFDHCFTPLIGTAKGVWATVTGIPDVELVKTASRNPMMVDQHTIINDFSDYDKYYFLGGSTSWANIRGILTNNIKDLKLYEEGSYDVPRVDVWGISDKNLFLQADKILRRDTKPFFAVVQTADNHRPYTIPEEDRSEFQLVNVAADSLHRFGFESNEELNAFRYTDFCFRKFIQQAATAPYFDNTLFVFIGDHGIAGDAGTMLPPAYTKNGLTANHVPLLFYSRKHLPALRLNELASQVDVLPTIAGIAGISYQNTALGRDLLRQHAADSGAGNRAFILDYNNKRVGSIYNNWYYSQSLQGSQPALVWAGTGRNLPAFSRPRQPITNGGRNRFMRLPVICYCIIKSQKSTIKSQKRRFNIEKSRKRFVRMASSGFFYF